MNKDKMSIGDGRLAARDWVVNHQVGTENWELIAGVCFDDTCQ